MSHQQNDLWADRASELLPYLTAEEALALNGAYEAHSEFPELIVKLEHKYSTERLEAQGEALGRSGKGYKPSPLAPYPDDGYDWSDQEREERE